MEEELARYARTTRANLVVSSVSHEFVLGRRAGSGCVLVARARNGGGKRLRGQHRMTDRAFTLTEVVIACAGLAAALPGFIASYVDIPVIGVALKGGMLDGLDALFSIVSTPKGIGLVSSGVGKSAFINAIIFALEILALGDKKYSLKLKQVKAKFKK